MRVLFMGTPEFALPCLEALASTGTCVGVVSQPDRRRNRNVLTPSPVKERALSLGLTVYTCPYVCGEGMEVLAALSPDVVVTCAFGQILTQEFLDMAPHGVINVHASLLPLYRGASPVQWAVLNGDRETGVSIMRTVLRLDAGDVLAVERTEIGPDETAGELSARLSVLAAPLLLRALEGLENGTAAFTPQDESRATYCRRLKKEDGLLDFGLPADELKRRVLGLNPWPSAYLFRDGKPLKVLRASETEGSGRPGEVLSASGKLTVACGEGALSLDVVQPAGGRPMTAAEYLRGHPVKAGTLF